MYSCRCSSSKFSISATLLQLNNWSAWILNKLSLCSTCSILVSLKSSLISYWLAQQHPIRSPLLLYFSFCSFTKFMKRPFRLTLPLSDWNNYVIFIPSGKCSYPIQILLSLSWELLWTSWYYLLLLHQQNQLSLEAVWQEKHKNEKESFNVSLLFCQCFGCAPAFEVRVEIKAPHKSTRLSGFSSEYAIYLFKKSPGLISWATFINCIHVLLVFWGVAYFESLNYG